MNIFKQIYRCMVRIWWECERNRGWFKDGLRTRNMSCFKKGSWNILEYIIYEYRRGFTYSAKEYKKMGI